MKNSTLDALAQFSKSEKELTKAVFSGTDAAKMNPRKDTVRNILNYSKALSVRKTKTLDRVFLVLN